MASIVGVHGIAQENKGSEVLEREWGPALRDGVGSAGGRLDATSLRCAVYGGLFRPSGEERKAGDVEYRESDLTEDDKQLLLLLWSEAARVEPERVVSPEAEI